MVMTVQGISEYWSAIWYPWNQTYSWNTLNVKKQTVKFELSFTITYAEITE